MTTSENYVLSSFCLVTILTPGKLRSPLWSSVSVDSGFLGKVTRIDTQRFKMYCPTHAMESKKKDVIWQDCGEDTNGENENGNSIVNDSDSTDNRNKNDQTFIVSKEKKKYY